MAKLWTRWCRLCAREDSSDTHVNVSFNQEDVSQSPLTETINKFFSINIISHDDWPHTICTRCHHLVSTIIVFAQRTTKVQMMFAELLNSVEELDAGKLKVQYELNELDDEEMDVKLFPNSLAVQLFESKPSTSEQMIDIKELECIDEKILNESNIRPELVYEDSHDTNVKECQDPLTSTANDECAKEPKKTRRSQPRKCEKPKMKRKTKTFTCAECNTSYTQYRNYRNHIKTVHVDQKLTIPCPYCDKKFTQAFMVQPHIRVVHMGEIQFICEECGKTCNTSGALKEHKLAHTEERPFKCKWCEKRFKSKPALKTHADTHDETNYICPICGLHLNTRRTLRMHMVVHSDQKRHKCGYCGNEYKRAKALKNHLILHTGLTPYTCNFCEKSFANGPNCRSHKKKAHPVELAAMEAAGTKSTTTKIPKLEHLRAVTSNKAVILESYKRVDTCAEKGLVMAKDAESLKEEDSPMEDQNSQQHTGLIHEVFGSMPAS